MKNISICSLLLFFVGFSTYADDKQEITAVARAAVDKVLVILKNSELPRDGKKAKILDVANKLFDMPLMAKLVLGRKHWSKFSETERTKFKDLFIELLQTSYFEKLELLTDEMVEFEEPTPIPRRKNQYSLKTYLKSKDEKIELGYKFYKNKNGNAWLVFDVEIEGVSILKSFGSQYREYLQDHSTLELFNKMNEKIENENKKKEAEKRKASKEVEK